MGDLMANNLTIDGNLTVGGTQTQSGSAVIGTGAASTLAFYGTTAVSQRSSSLQTTTNVVTSASFGTLQVAQLQEVQNALIGLGLIKGS
jgi:hypothetical protein